MEWKWCVFVNMNITIYTKINWLIYFYVHHFADKNKQTDKKLGKTQCSHLFVLFQSYTLFFTLPKMLIWFVQFFHRVSNKLHIYFCAPFIQPFWLKQSIEVSINWSTREKYRSSLLRFYIFKYWHIHRKIWKYLIYKIIGSICGSSFEKTLEINKPFKKADCIFNCCLLMDKNTFKMVKRSAATATITPSSYRPEWHSKTSTLSFLKMFMFVVRCSNK